ncbi:MAG: hypothetical protein ACOH2G_08345 [Ewingella sp.]
MNTAEASLKSKSKSKSKTKTKAVFIFKKAWAAFRNAAEREVENRVFFYAGCNPKRRNRNAAVFRGYRGGN